MIYHKTREKIKKFFIQLKRLIIFLGKNLTNIKDIVIIISTILGFFLAINTLHSWKLNVINPVRNEIVKKQVNDLIEKLDFTTDKIGTNVFGDTPFITLLYYLEKTDSERYFNKNSTYTTILNSYLEKLKKNEYKIEKIKEREIIANKKIIRINIIFISKNIQEYENYFQNIVNDPYLSDSIRENAKKGLATLIKFQGIYLPKIIEEILTSYTKGNKYNPENILDIISKQTNVYEDSISKNINDIKEEMENVLRIKELYNLSK